MPSRWRADNLTAVLSTLFWNVCILFNMNREGQQDDEIFLEMEEADLQGQRLK
jgi:hypothetical protein